MPLTDVEAADRLNEVHKALKVAQKRFDSSAGVVTLVAVSKTFSAEAILPFLRAGQRVFGENRVQEAKQKWPSLRQAFAGVELHLIGPLQTNKARDAVNLFDCIQTVDRESLAGVLRVEMSRAERELPCFVQVNIGNEPQKTGVAPEETVAFVERCRLVHKLNIVGLMAIPPEGQPAGAYFASLAMLGRAAGVTRLSMGMSADYQTAIAMGATHVRLGSALFGYRPPMA